MKENMENEMIAFTQELVRIRSYSGQEESVVRCIADRMKALGFDEVTVDSMGNVLGRIGNGKKSCCLIPISTRWRSRTRKPGRFRRSAAKSWMGGFMAVVLSI